MYCECGCGRVTNIAKQTDTKKGWVKGQHYRCCLGHNKGHSNNYQGVDKWVEKNQNTHICACGCGGYIVVKKHHYNVGIPKYIHGHHSKTPKNRELKRVLCETRTGELSPRWKKDRSQVRSNRTTITFLKRQKREIYLRDEGKCQMCGTFCLLDVSNQDPCKANIHHIVAVKDGGSRETSNGQVLCVVCHKYVHSVKAKRMNCWEPRTGNQQPSSQSEKVQRLLESSDTLNNQEAVSSPKGMI